MTDPLTMALSVYKGAKIAGSAKGLFERLSRANTQRFIAERDEMHRGWTAETAMRLAEHVTESREKFIAFGGTLEEHERLLDQLLDQHEVRLLASLYADASYREVIAERRRMLSFAAASILDLQLTIEEKASVERVLRGLDPVDVLELHKLSRAVGCIRRLRNGYGERYASTEALRYGLLEGCVSDDALSSARCVRETVIVARGDAGAGGDLHQVAYVTERGALVLRVLAKYIDERHDAFVGCGREEIQGARSEVDARKAVAEINGFMAAVRAAIQAAHALQGWLSAQFEQAQPTFKPSARQLGVTVGDVTEPSPQAISTLRLPAVPPALAQAIPQPPQGHALSVEFEDLPHYGRPATNVLIRGPHDILRWVADDLDARWR